MSKALVSVTVMFIGATNATVCYLDADLGWSQFAMANCLDNVSIAGAFEISEVNAHGCRWTFQAEWAGEGAG
jgi:hypothetical protein